MAQLQLNYFPVAVEFRRDDTPADRTLNHQVSNT